MQEARQDTGTGAGPEALGKGPGSATQALPATMPLPVQTAHAVRTASTILDELGVLQELPQEVLPALIAKTVVRRGRGGRQKQVDPLHDPRFAGLEPSKVARIMANREAAARSKLKAKLLKELQLQKLKGPPGSSSSMPAPKPAAAAAAKTPAARSTARTAAAAAGQKENGIRPAAAAAAAAAVEVDALAALDCLAAVAAEEELLAPAAAAAAAAAGSSTPGHRSTADPHGWQQDAGAHRQRDSRRSSSSAAAAAAAAQLGCDEQQLQSASSGELADLHGSDAADRAAHARVMARLQQLQQQRRGGAAAAAAAAAAAGDASGGSGGSFDSGRRKRASPESAAADTAAAAAAAHIMPGLLGLLRCCVNSKEAGGWTDLQLTALAVLDSLAGQDAGYKDALVAAGAPVVLLRLLEAAGSMAVQLAAVRALQGLLSQQCSVKTVEGLAAAGGVEVLLLAVARGKAGSALRQAAAGCLVSMAQLAPGHDEVAVAAAGVRHMAQPSVGAASSSRT
ncbi:hypothetical protein OEZ85_013753 [Tetradesmus obliquus]|uniref:RING-type E3 ubiquitin transferase n=1 Tax=Tetradesmus obliquus TaxID=3088 RepID=A0ABY8U5Z4_TETOB|nr:hypothetical protein OEZ85_013753 [Tetradesmus obliquus]